MDIGSQDCPYTGPARIILTGACHICLSFLVYVTCLLSIYSIELTLVVKIVHRPEKLESFSQVGALFVCSSLCLLSFICISGRREIGSEDCPYTGPATIIFTGSCHIVCLTLPMLVIYYLYTHVCENGNCLWRLPYTGPARVILTGRGHTSLRSLAYVSCLIFFVFG